LINELLAEGGVYATNPARQHLLRAASGDLYLIRRLTGRSAEIASTRASLVLRSRDVANLIQRFLRDDVLRYAPLLEAIRLIE
jgi:hypothetical protein